MQSQINLPVLGHSHKVIVAVCRFCRIQKKRVLQNPIVQRSQFFSIICNNIRLGCYFCLGLKIHIGLQRNFHLLRAHILQNHLQLPLGISLHIGKAQVFHHPIFSPPYAGNAANRSQNTLKAAVQPVGGGCAVPDVLIKIALLMTGSLGVGLNVVKGRASPGQLLPRLLNGRNINSPPRGRLHRLKRIQHNIKRPVDTLQRLRHTVVKGQRGPHCRHQITSRCSRSSPPGPAALAAFGRPAGLLLLLLFPLGPDISRRNHKSPLPSGQGQKLVRQQMQLVQAKVADISLPVARLNQFFASSTSSCKLASKPQTSCTLPTYSAYSPGVSIVFSKASSPTTR